MARPRRCRYLLAGAALSAACLSTASVSVLNAARSISMPFSTVLQCRVIAAIATASLISASVAPFALATAAWK